MNEKTFGPLVVGDEIEKIRRSRASSKNFQTISGKTPALLKEKVKIAYEKN